MTWAGATPVLLVCLVFDAVGSFFAMSWLIGPALAAAYCTVEGGAVLETWTVGLLGTKTAAAVCSYTAIKAGVAFSAPLTTFGTIMDMAIGLFGWLTVGLILIIKNARIFKENTSHTVWFVVSLLISETPIIGTVPALTATMWRLYHTQIKTDKEALKKYEKENADAQMQERNRQTSEVMRARATQAAEIEAANEELHAEAVNDKEIPEEMRGAA